MKFGDSDNGNIINEVILFAIRHHLPGGIDLSISEFCNFIIYFYLEGYITRKFTLKKKKKKSMDKKLETLIYLKVRDENDLLGQNLYRQ
jgi:hypothetical protein